MIWRYPARSMGISPVLPLSSIGNLRESKTRNPIRSLSHDNWSQDR